MAEEKTFFIAFILFLLIGLTVSILNDPYIRHRHKKTLLLIIGLWNGIHDFRPAYFQALLFLEVMNWFDGSGLIFPDMLTVVGKNNKNNKTKKSVDKLEETNYNANRS